MLPGPLLADGQPSWTLHDPARHQFYRIDWPAFEMLSRWSMGSAKTIVDDIRRQTTLQADTKALEELQDFLKRHQLLCPDAQSGSAEMAAQVDKARTSPLKWLLHHYLFFRVPLLRPDAWLTSWLPMARRLMSAEFFWLTMAALVTGLFLVARHWDTFRSSLVDSFSLDGLLSYGLALFFVKALHELGHAFTAKHHGCRVPTMGLAFLVMWPVAYTDTNESWRIVNHRQRLQVAAAGIVTELAIAAWATLAWGLLPDGAFKSAAFALATTSWVATLAINASPFMRFDGYYILSDAVDIPNLHERAGALARWRLREWLFRLGDPVPEHFSARRQRMLIAFSVATWIYRLTLFIGIAVMVYHAFFKLLGVILFTVEIMWFILMPLIQEMRVWHSRRAIIRQSGRARWSLMLVLALLSACLIPWPGRIAASGLLRPAEVWPVHAPAGAQITALNWTNGDMIPAGTTLVNMAMPDLEARLQTARSKLETLRWQSASASLSDDTRQHRLTAEEALQTAQTELDSLHAQARQLSPEAPWPGRWVNMDPDLHPGQWVAAHEAIGQLVKVDSPWIVETWLDEDNIARIQTGTSASFHADGGTSSPLGAEVISIDADASHTLPRPELAAQQGGHILTREQQGQIIPERAIYRVRLAIQRQTALTDEVAPTDGMIYRGTVTFHAQGEAPATRFLRQIAAVLMRETGF